MAKFEHIAERISSDARAGLFGKPGDRFLTVRALAHRFSISMSTAQKVMARLRSTGILVGHQNAPSVLGPPACLDAKGRTGGAQGPIALVLPDLSNPFFGRLARAVQRSANRHGRSVVTSGRENELSQERDLIDHLLGMGVEGLIVCPGLDDASSQLYREMLAQGTPLVFVSRCPENVEADFVSAHNMLGGLAMAAHFVDRGYTTAGYIGFGPRLKRDNRLSGFRTELVEHGIDLPAEFIADDNGREIENGYRAMGRLMSQASRPRAVFAYNDLLAIGALQYCHDRGIGVPTEVAVGGFDNLPEARVTAPPLTTIAYPVDSIAQMAVQCLIDRFETHDTIAVRRILLEPHLIVRGSTAIEATSYRTHLFNEGVDQGGDVDEVKTLV